MNSLNRPSYQCLQSHFQGYFAGPRQGYYFQPDDTGIFIDVIGNLQQTLRPHNIPVSAHLEDMIQDTFRTSPKESFQPERLHSGYKLSHGWGQDTKAIWGHHDSNTPVVVEPCEPEDEEQGIAESFAHQLSLPYRKLNSSLEGGNYFLGLKNENEWVALIGEQEVLSSDKSLVDMKKRDFRKQLKQLSPEKKEAFLAKGMKLIQHDINLPSDNIFYLPQPEYHLDLGILPLIYPYVLVGSVAKTKLWLDTLSHQNGLTDEAGKSLKKLADCCARYEKHLARESYASGEEVASVLEQQGFKPIMIPGIIADADAKEGSSHFIVNYLNALVTQDKNGDLIYSGSETPVFEGGFSLDKAFEQELRKALKESNPVLESKFISTHFVYGDPLLGRDDEYLPGEVSFLSDRLRVQKGGLHCMVTEYPDFKEWKTQIQKDRKELGLNHTEGNPFWLP